MDIHSLRSAFEHAVLWVCGLGIAAIALAYAGYLLARFPGKVRRSIRTYGLPTVIALAALMVFAAIEGTPTNEDKERYRQQHQQQGGLPDPGQDCSVPGDPGTGSDSDADGLSGIMTLELGDDDYGTDGSDGATEGAGTIDAEPLTLPDIRPLTESDYAAGIVLSQIGTDETHSFEPIPGAEVCDDWRRFGAARDWFKSTFTNGWSFAFGTNSVDALTVFSYGTTRPSMTNTTTFVSPFHANIGVLPSANDWMLCAPDGLESSWTPIPDPVLPSRFWQALTPSNTFVMCWQNVPWNRDVHYPFSFMIEFEEKGDITFRYDMSRLPDPVVTNVTVGIGNGGLGRTFNAIPRDVTSLKWSRVTEADRETSDRDGDGLPTVDEILIHHTNPDLADSDCDGSDDAREIATGSDPTVRDSDGDGLVDGSDPHPTSADPLDDLDGDGIPDVYESHWFGGTNAVDAADVRDGTGFTLSDKILAGMNPTNAVFATETVVTNRFLSWKLWDGFAMERSSSSTNLVFERTIRIDRTSAWQRFYLSASPGSAEGWCLEGASLEWNGPDGEVRAVNRSPFGDSLPLELPETCEELTLRLCADSSFVVSRKPLYLIAYSPDIRIEGPEVTLPDGRTAFVFVADDELEIPVSFDSADRPCNTDTSDGERILASLSATPGLVYEGDASGGVWRPSAGGVYSCSNLGFVASGAASRARALRRAAPSDESGWPTLIVLAPYVRYGCNGHSLPPYGLGWDDLSREYARTYTYPLDSNCLWRSFHSDATGAVDCLAQPEYGSGLGEDLPYVECEPVVSADRVDLTVKVCGREFWRGSDYHNRSAGSVDEVELLSSYDECGGCSGGCSEGDCEKYSRPEAGSLSFRQDLGAPRQGQLSGFLWFRTEEDVCITPSLFDLRLRSDAVISDSTSAGIRTIACGDERGRTAIIEPIANGVLITVNTTAKQSDALEFRWEITNVGGQANRVRFRKLSRQNNVMLDETYVHVGDGEWRRTDNVAGATEIVTKTDRLTDEGWIEEERTLEDGSGNTLSYSLTHSERIGVGDGAVLRETYFESQSGCRYADYWNDPTHPARHGKLRLLTGDLDPWTYHEYDERGCCTLTVAELNGSSYPWFLTEATEPFGADILQLASDGFRWYDSLVTLYDYTPHPGDACNAADSDVVRTETRYAIQDGEAILIGRTWTRCRREDRNGYPAVIVETSRAADAQSVPFGASSANSRVATWDADSPLVPLVLKGRTCESRDENGVLTQMSVVSLSEGYVVTTRKSKGGHPFDTYTVDLFDHNHGNLLREQVKLTIDDAVIAEETHRYDEKNRLRTTTWLDGTSMTNAYSCCRLLWSRDREGRTTLRSAKTGEDHLYHAYEDVWLGENSTNGAHRVRQYFYDALGREIATTVSASNDPGAATNSTSVTAQSEGYVTTRTEYWGDDVERTDERGCVRYTQNSHGQSYDYTYEYVFADEEARRNWNYDMDIDTYSYRNGPTETYTYWSGGWKRDYTLPHYDPTGRRVTISSTESYDCGLVTNSVTIADWLGRTVSERNPLGVTTTVYDGLTDRAVAMTTTFGEGSVVRERIRLYNALGESIGYVQDGITNSTVVAYERLNADWYRVTTDAVVGPGTNSVSVAKERLTGLGDEFVSETITVTPDGVETVERKWQSDIWASVLTENSLGVWRDDEFCCGIGCDSCAEGESWVYMTDAFGRSVGTMHWSDWERNVFDKTQTVYSPAGDVVARQTLTEDGFLTESRVYDTYGRLVSVTNAEGGVIEYSYDCFDRRISETGATYPVRYGYDSEGRRMSLKTTRDGGLTWDETRWTYDSAAGLCLSKTYADGSVVRYTYTSDGRPLRTTEASGAWKECLYDLSRRLVGVISSDGAQDAFFEHDAFGRTVLESNTVALVSYSLDRLGLATNEVQTVDGVSVVLQRTSDEFGRQVSFTRVGGIVSLFAYTNGTHLASVTTPDASARYRFSNDWLDEGYEMTVGSRTFDRWTSHDWYRRGLVDGVWYAQGDHDDCIIYSYDSMGRPSARNNDVFGYNARGEIVSATIGGQFETHVYNDIGTHVTSTDPSANTAYASNARNQYASIVRTADAAQEGEPVSVAYDADGSLTTFGPWTYDYDSGRRLTSVASNGVTVATMAYDAQGRRVKKVAADGTHRYFYDGWLLVYEHITHADSTVDEIDYVWGKDISDLRNGAAGIGGLLYLKRNGAIYVPYADAYGNILGYWDANGNLVASYTYNVFGKMIAQEGPMADAIALRYSTKYWDVESGLYYYGYRYYNPLMQIWLSSDPLFESGGLNLYQYCRNQPTFLVDELGLKANWHHLLPKQFQDKFSAAGLDINAADFGVILEEVDHTGKGGIHPSWNRSWAEFFEKYPNASKEQILGQLKKMKAMPEYRSILGKGVKAPLSYSAWRPAAAAARQKAAKEVSESVVKSVVKRGGKKVIKKVPVVSLVFVFSDIHDKGFVGGVCNTLMDACPFVGWGKLGIECITGDWFPDKSDEE